MARKPRTEYPGAIYHVTARGNAGDTIYRGDGDRRFFLDVMAEAASRYRLLLHAYCLMDNHYHLVVETPDANLARAMQYLNSAYTRHYNRLYRRTGHVFQGRYTAVPVERDSQLLELCRYLSLNPVRAGIAADPADYPWSSYRAMIGRAKPVNALHVSWILSCFSPEPNLAPAMFRDFVRDGIERTRLVPGIARTADTTSPAPPAGKQASRTTEPGPASGRIERPSLAKIFEGRRTVSERNAGIHAAYVDHAYTQGAIASFLGVSRLTVTRAVRQLERCAGDTGVR